MTDKDFIDRTTMRPGEVSVVKPDTADPAPVSKFYMGTRDGKAPSEEEALKAGRALFDAINTQRARQARSE